MAKSIEIELRYEVLDKVRLTQFLQKLEYISSKRIVDVYVDTPLGDLLRMGVFIRIRNDKTLDIKFNRACLHDPTLARQDHCEEYSFALPLQENDLPKLNEVCQVFGFGPLAFADVTFFKKTHHLIDSYCLDKTRTSYTDGEFTFALDEIIGLGTFLEIEVMATDTQNLQELKRCMQQLLSGLSLALLKTGYVTLMLRKTNFERYLQSRFVLEEDRVDVR